MSAEMSIVLFIWIFLTLVASMAAVVFYALERELIFTVFIALAPSFLLVGFIGIGFAAFRICHELGCTLP